MSIDSEKMAQSAAAASSLLKSLANENRLMLVCALIERELSVGELNELIPLSQSALSQHLAYLRKAGLVDTRRQAQTIYYRVKGDEAITLITALKSIYCPE